MLNWFTFGVMFITIVLLMVTCYYLEFKRKSENQTIEHLLKTYINICDSLENDKQELKDKNASLEKEIKLMKSININDNYVSKDKIRERIKINEELIKEPSKWKYTENEIRNFKIENMCLKELLEE